MKTQILLLVSLVFIINCSDKQNQVLNKCEPQGIHINYGDKYSSKQINNVQMQIIFFTISECKDNQVEYYQNQANRKQILGSKRIYSELSKVYFHYFYIQGLKEYDKLVYYNINYPQFDDEDENNNNNDNNNNDNNNNDNNNNDNGNNLRQRNLQIDYINPPVQSETFYFNFPRDNQNQNDMNKLIFFGDFGLNDMKKSQGTLDSLQKIVDDKEQLKLYKGVVHVGDIAYDMQDDNGLKGLQYLKDTQSIFSKIPYITVAGNHERDLRFYQDTFPNIMQNEKLYYSWNIGNIHLIGLFGGLVNQDKNQFSEENQNFIKEQQIFLEQDLISATKSGNKEEYPWIIVYFHEPLICSYENDFDKNDQCNKIPNQDRIQLQRILEKYNVDLVIQAHVHQYERSFPINSQINTNHSKTDFKKIADYYDRSYDCEYKSTKKCQIFHQPEGIIYTVEGVPGTEHFLQEVEYELENYTAYKGQLEYSNQPGQLQTGYAIVSSNSRSILSYEHFNTNIKKVVDSFKIEKIDSKNNNIEDETGDLIPNLDGQGGYPLWLKLMIGTFIAVILFIVGLIIYRIVRRKMVNIEGQNLIEESDNNNNNNNSNKVSNIQFDLPSLDDNNNMQPLEPIGEGNNDNNNKDNL